MVWDKWIPRKYLVKSEVFVVEACFEDESVVYYFTHLKNQGNKLTLSETGSLTELKFPPFVLKKKLPLVLITNGRGVIVKKIDLNELSAKSLDELIQSNLPAINPNDFYIQLYRQENATAFISLCRKSILDPILDQLAKNNYELADVFIGSPSVIGLQPLWSKFNTLELSRQKVELTNGFVDLITSPESTEKNQVVVQDIVLSRDHVLGLAGGLAYFMQRTLAESNAPLLSTFFLKHKENNKLRFLALTAVSIAFVLAITNVFFYSFYFDKNNKLETELAVYQGKYDQINTLLEDYQKNKDLIEGAGVLGRNRLSEYADRIGKTLPEAVVLSELNFNPKHEKDESLDSLITFDNKKLILKGNCEKSFIVNEWLSVLKMQKFIKDVNLEKFVYNNNGLAPNFEIKLTVD